MRQFQSYCTFAFLLVSYKLHEASFSVFSEKAIPYSGEFGQVATYLRLSPNGWMCLGTGNIQTGYLIFQLPSMDQSEPQPAKKVYNLLIIGLHGEIVHLLLASPFDSVAPCSIFKNIGALLYSSVGSGSQLKFIKSSFNCLDWTLLEAITRILLRISCLASFDKKSAQRFLVACIWQVPVNIACAAFISNTMTYCDLRGRIKGSARTLYYIPLYRCCMNNIERTIFARYWTAYVYNKTKECSNHTI